MALEAKAGPVIVWGQQPAVSGSAPPDYNQDAGPSMLFGGSGLLDMRYGYKEGGGQAGFGNNANLAIGFTASSYIITVNQAPATAATANIAALANVTLATPMTLVSATGAGVTVLGAATVVLPSGNTVASGKLALDGAPGTVAYGQTGAVLVYDVTKSIARAVSVTGVSGGAGGDFTVAGYDVYGYPLSETITAAAGVATTNGKKAFKFITSVTPAFTDAHNYSIGTTDIFGLALRVNTFAHATFYWNNALITAATGFVAAVSTAASATSGDVRGTYAVQSASDGTKALQVFITPGSAALASQTGLYGVTQFSS